jgi:arylsulfatase
MIRKTSPSCRRRARTGWTAPTARSAPVVASVVGWGRHRPEDADWSQARSLQQFKFKEKRRRDLMQRPNVVYFNVDNLGYGELGCYGGGVLRGADTRRIDEFAREGFQLLNHAPEAQCTPSRSALLTGRHAIRSGNHTVATAGGEGSGLVAWERTLGDLFSEAGYATMCMGKWHIGDADGRWPTDHGFDEWYGPPHSYDEAMWESDPLYVPGRDPVSYMLDGRKGKPVQKTEKLTYDLKLNIDVEYKRRSFDWMERNAQAKKPFFLYYNHSLMHVPVAPRAEYRGKSGKGDWADSLLELDQDFGDLLDKIDALGLAADTIVVFAGENGADPNLLHMGTSGFFEGSYFTGMEGALRTPGIARWPKKIAAGRKSNEVFHITDWFTTLITMAGLKVPADRVIDGKDQSPFLYGKQKASNREGFLYWNGARLYGVKWQDFKLALVDQRTMFGPAPEYGFPNIRNLMWDPKETQPVEPRHFSTWTMAHFERLMKEFAESVKREPLIPCGAPLDYVPRGIKRGDG